MSAQCWCFSCAGRVVTRQTFRRHGRKDKPDAPIQPESLGVESMPAVGGPSACYDRDPGSDSSLDDVDVDPLGLSAEVTDGDRTGVGQLSPAEVTLLLLDWMCAHKTTDSSAVDLWALIGLLLPGQVPYFHHHYVTLRDLT